LGPIDKAAALFRTTTATTINILAAFLAHFVAVVVGFLINARYVFNFLKGLRVHMMGI